MSFTVDVSDTGISQEKVTTDGKAVDITEQILGAAIAVHRALRPGLLESTYEACLAFERVDRGLPIARQLLPPRPLCPPW